MMIQDLYTEESSPMHKIGELYIDQATGNKFRYTKFGATLVTGNLLQEPVESTDWDNMALAVVGTLGQDHVHVTLGSTATTAGLFANGYLYVSYGTGIGQKFNIKRHDVASAAATCIFYLDRPLKIALTTASSKITIRKNPCDGVIQYPITTQTGGAVGFALYAATSSYYGWVQSGGDTAVLYDTGTNTSNGVTGIGPSSAVAGSVKPQTGAEGGIVIGFARDVVSTDSYMGIAHITID